MTISTGPVARVAAFATLLFIVAAILPSFTPGPFHQSTSELASGQTIPFVVMEFANTSMASKHIDVSDGAKDLFYIVLITNAGSNAVSCYLNFTLGPGFNLTNISAPSVIVSPGHIQDVSFRISFPANTTAGTYPLSLSTLPVELGTGRTGRNQSLAFEVVADLFAISVVEPQTVEKRVKQDTVAVMTINITNGGNGYDSLDLDLNVTPLEGTGIEMVTSADHVFLAPFASRTVMVNVSVEPYGEMGEYKMLLEIPSESSIFLSQAGAGNPSVARVVITLVVEGREWSDSETYLFIAKIAISVLLIAGIVWGFMKLRRITP